MNEFALLLGAFLCLGAYLALLWCYRTCLMGLSGMNLFAVASASFAAFVFGSLSGQAMDWFESSHARVLQYSITGCLMMVTGMWLAWLPLLKAQRTHRFNKQAYPPFPGWLNPTMGWMTFALGVAATVAYMALQRVPTVSTGLYAVGGFARFGIFILLLVALRTGRWRHFVLATALALPVFLATALASGHTPISTSLVLPIVLMLTLYGGLLGRSFIIMTAAGFSLLLLFNAWMSTRDIIRSGELSAYEKQRQAAIFLTAIAKQLDPAQLTANRVQSLLLERVDMSTLLAAQVEHQPASEPYALGKTLLNAFPAMVPRALWPEKPQVAGGSEFFQRYTGLYRSDDDATSIGLPYQFELYANGGPWLVVIGLFVIGYVAGRMELLLIRDHSHLGWLWALGVATLVVCDGGQRMDITVPALVAGGLAACAVGWCLQWLFPNFVERMLNAPRALDTTESSEKKPARRIRRRSKPCQRKRNATADAR